MFFLLFWCINIKIIILIYFQEKKYFKNNYYYNMNRV